MEDSKDLQQQSKALDKLTDRVEDRQLYSTRVQEINFMIYFSMYGYNLDELVILILILIYFLLFLFFGVGYLAMASITAPKKADIQPARMRVVIIILFLAVLSH